MAGAVKGANLEGMDLPEAKKKYILEKVNPLLEELVRAVLTRMPDEPLAFMIKFLKEKTGRANVDMDAVTKENAYLEEEIAQMQFKLKDASSKAAEILGGEGKKAVDEDEEEEEEEDDYVDEIPEEYMQSQATSSRMRTSVSAEAYGEWNKKKEFKPPKHPKSDEQRKRIETVLSKNFLFSSLDEQQATIILDAVEEVIIPKGQRIINQGDEGSFMFVIESGSLECFIKKPDGEEIMVKTVDAGDAFGELSLLYNAPRAASVQAKDRCVCWKLDRETFNAIVKDAAQAKRDRYMKFFENVPLLSAVDAYGRSQIADALTKKSVAKGTDIITQGDPADNFYIIEEGECTAKKKSDSGADVNMELKTGDYFGELALLSGDPRAASVTAVSDNVKLLCLDRKAFSRLLGPLREMLMQGQNRYG
jgi:cAMP-dependent protein kinase regulator